MTLDPYKLCPGGTGKKIKFCGCKDIVHQLDEVLRKLEGDQRASAIEQIDRLLTTNPDRACLLALKGEVLIQHGEIEEAKPTVAAFVVQCPDNPVALSLSAMIEVGEGNVSKAVVALQRAMECVRESVPMAVYRAMVTVGEALLVSGRIMAARAHLLVLASISNTNNSRAFELLDRLHGSESIPLLLKQDTHLAKCPRDAEYAESFGQALGLASQFTWLAAVERLESLAQQYPKQAAILKNIAILRSWLGDPEKTIPAWRRLAQLEDLPLEDAVEAEALAQLLDPESVRDRVDVLHITYPVKDVERLQEVLASDRRISLMPVDPRELAVESDEPPPKGVYWLLDRPLPTSGTEIAVEDVPLVLGEVFLFGRQTDRDARVEFSVTRSEDFDTKVSVLADVTGELLDAATGEEVTDQIGAIAEALTWSWRFPQDTPMEHRSRLAEERQRSVLSTEWPKVRMSVLGGHSPEEVASDPNYRVRLLAAILRFELGERKQHLSADHYNQLREQLGLPIWGDIEPDKVDVRTIPVVRLHRVDPARLSDELVIACFRRTLSLGAITATERFAKEVISRESLDQHIENVEMDKAEAYDLLAHYSADNDEAMGYFRKARDFAIKDGQSVAHWLLVELEMRLSRGIIDECQELVEQIQTRHMNEPGVAQTLYEVLVRFGLISPEGQPAAGRPATPEPPVADVAQTAEPTSKIWTPDSPAEPSQSGGGKSKLWIPDTQ